MKPIRYQDIWVRGRRIRRGIRDCEKRYWAIKRVAEKIRPKNILDIGADKGYFSFRLSEDFGAKCTMVEQRRDIKGIVIANHNPKIKLINKTFSLEGARGLGRYDLILCMSILHHFDNWREIFRALLEKTGNIIVETPNADEDKRTKNYSITPDIIGEIKKHENEIICRTPSGSGKLRSTFWIKNIKPTYINEAFRHIHEYDPKRILHVGGYVGEEGEIYKSIGAEFTFVEPVPEYAEKIREKGYSVIETAIGERGERDFNVRGIFSSLLERKEELLPGQEKWLKEHNEKKGQIRVKVIPLLDIQEGYDTLVVDTEGTVLDVLKSGNLNFKTIIVEIRSTPAYDEEPPNEEINKYLAENGYVEDKKYGNNIIFIKKKWSN